MALIKHIAIKNVSYSDALAYLKFEHDEFTNKPILDDNGEMIRRQFVMLEGINCTPETYGSECTRLNRQYGKNNASYAAATPDEEGIGQHDYQSNNDSDHRKTRLNAKKERLSRLPVGRRNERSLSF